MNITKQEIKTINGIDYNYVEYDKHLPDGTPYSDLTYIQTEADVLQAFNQSRINELETTIARLKLLEIDCVNEQAELKQLLGL